MLITPEYQQLQQQFHIDRPDYGVSGHKFVEPVLGFSEKLKTRDILDYGCGKATLQKGIPFPIQNYDPCMPEYAKRPRPADLVVCSDVLEHIEPDCLEAVLADLAALTKVMLLVNVACRPAKKFLPDGRNAHIIQESPTWWLQKLFLYPLELVSFQAQQGEFTALLVPHKNDENAV